MEQVGQGMTACIDAPVTIAPRQLVTIPTGIAIALPSADYVALIFARSGLGVKHGISLSNGVGVIDSDYRGELKVGLTNLSDEPYTSSRATGWHSWPFCRWCRPMWCRSASWTRPDAAPAASAPPENNHAERSIEICSACLKRRKKNLSPLLP